MTNRLIAEFEHTDGHLVSVRKRSLDLDSYFIEDDGKIPQQGMTSDEVIGYLCHRLQAVHHALKKVQKISSDASWDDRRPVYDSWGQNTGMWR